MQKRAGTFIAIEGTDGSGKGTQFELLCKRLQQAGYDVATFDFPQYDSPSSYFVKQYLNGEYGSADQVGPYTASLFYALDRYEAAPAIQEALERGKVVVCNRFTGSNMGHQGTKFKHAEERRGFFIWLDNLEFEMLRIPRPDTNVILRVPAEIAHDLIGKKKQRAYTDKKRDIHEADLKHLERSVAVYDDMAQLFPRDFQRIDCVRGDKLLSVEAIQNLLWEKITPLLPPPPQLELTTKDIPSPAAAAVEASRGSISSPARQTGPANAGPSAPATAAPDKKAADGSSQAQKAAVPSTTTATEPRPATGFREVMAQHFVLEHASNMLAQAIEASPLAAYVGEPEADASYAPQPDGQYPYYTPETLDKHTAATYRTAMDALFALHTRIVDIVAAYLTGQPDTSPGAHSEIATAELRKQAIAAARAVLPAAATTKVVVLAFGTALEDMVAGLLASGLPELHAAGESLLREARTLSPGFLADADKPGNAASPIAYRTATAAAVRALVQKHLPVQHAAESQAVQLTAAWPRNELDILADIAYTYSNLPVHELRSEISQWPYNRKLDLMEAAMGERTSPRQQPGRAFDSIRYSWDIVSSYGAFRTLQQRQLIAGASAQELTPRYGYDVPDLIEAAGAADLYEQCFDASLALYSHLQQAGFTSEAQYATLLGHRLRWKLSHSALDALRLLEGATASEATAKLTTQMHAALAETHPLVAELADVHQAS